MSFEFIAQIVFVFSFLGIFIIFFQKIPVLAQLPKVVEKPQRKRKKIQYNLLLQKLLARVRILTLKTDHKTYNWLQKLREKSQKKKFQQDDNYWEKIRKSTKKK